MYILSRVAILAIHLEVVTIKEFTEEELKELFEWWNWFKQHYTHIILKKKSKN